MIDSKIKKFNEFEQVNEGIIPTREMANGKSIYEVKIIDVKIYEDDYNEGESTKPYYSDYIAEPGIVATSIDELLSQLNSDYSHWTHAFPISKETTYYAAPYVRYSSGTVNNHWDKLSKSEEEAWKEGTFKGYVIYLDIAITKTEYVPKAEIAKYVGKE